MLWRKVMDAVTVLGIVFFMGSSLNVFAAETATGQDMYTKAQSAWEKGEWETALSLCDDTLKVNKRYKDAWLLKGQISSQMKNHKMALSCYDEYLKIDPKNAQVWVNRGATLFELERYKEMQDSFDRALAIDPRYTSLYKNMGVNYLLMGAFDESYKAFQKLEELGETSMYSNWTKRMLKITNESLAPPESWNAKLSSYQIVLDLPDPTKADYLVNITSTEGTAIKFAGTSEKPFKYAPNFEVWDGAMIFDKKGDGLLANGTHFRYTKITGETMTREEGQIYNWRLGLSSKKCFLLSQ